MSKNWIRSESRSVRPFVTIEQALEGTALRLTKDGEFRDAPAVDIDSVDPGQLNPEVLLKFDIDAVRGAWPRAEQAVNLMVKVADLQLRRTYLALDCPLDKVPDTLGLQAAVTRPIAWTSGAKVTVALVLKADKVPQPGKPFMKGHWIARKDFRVDKKSMQHAFPITRWTAEDFQKAKLPADTAYWVELCANDFNCKFESADEAFRLCVRADIYDVLADTQGSASSRAILGLILSEVVTDIAFAGLRNLGDREELLGDGVLAGLLKRLQKATGVTRDVLVARAKDGDRSTIRAHVQAMQSIRKSIVEAKPQT